MTIAIIHSDKRKDRWELLQKELIEQEIADYIMFPAVYMDKPKQGINRAHKNVVEFAKKNNLEEICIWEDDVHFVAKGAWQYFLNKKPKDYDIYLSSIMWGRIDGDNTVPDYAGNQCYFIHQRFYDTFLEADRNKDIDRAIARKGRFIVCQPFATMQHETVSDNRRKIIHRNAKIYFNRTFFNGTNG